MNEEKREKILKIVSTIVLCCFVFPIGFLILKLIYPDLLIESFNRTRSDYALMLFQCLLGIFVLLYPNMILKKKSIQIPSTLYLLYVIFLFCAIFLGEVRDFYYVVPYWDIILHTFSGGMIAALGFSFISLLNNEDNTHLKLTPFLVAFFAFTFAITMGVVWEIYEYISDGLLGLNMQKFALKGGIELVGRAAVQDTMTDLIVDGIGAFVISAIGYISLKKKDGWIEKILIRKEK